MNQVKVLCTNTWSSKENMIIGYISVFMQIKDVAVYHQL